MCLFTLLQGDGEELVQLLYIVQRVCRNLRLCTMLVAGVNNGGSVLVLVRTIFMRFYFR